jgi:glycosyl transferase family 1/glycosyl transferase family 4
MKRVLVLAYHFPPRGGPGVQRAVKFIRYLPEFGFEPVVVTGPAEEERSFAPGDATLAGELPADLETYRVAGPEPPEAEGWHGRTERWLRLRSDWSRWWADGALAAGRNIPGIDVILATMSPFQSTSAAASLSQALGVPWVADLRDPWVLDEMQVYETGLHRRLDLAAMRRSLASTAGIVMNTPEAAASLGRAFPELADRTIVLPNGYDAADFAAQPPTREDDAFRIVHAGYLHTGLGEDHRRARILRAVFGGAIGDIDILPRSHVYLLEAVERLLAARPELRSFLEVHLVGRLTESDRRAIASDVVQTRGYLPHSECLDVVRTADLLFLPMHDLVPGHRARIVPGKTYEYLASGRPILAAIPDGDARDLLSSAPLTLLARPTDVEALARLIGEEVDRFRREGREASAARDLGRFERRALTERLSALLSAACVDERAAVQRSSIAA